MKINNQILAQRIATKHANNYCDAKTLRNKSSFNECYQSALEMANEKDKEIAELNRKYNELKNTKK